MSQLLASTSHGSVIWFGGANPICFLLRHAIELALKIVQPGQGHLLAERLDLVAACGATNKMEEPNALRELVIDFVRVDPKGTAFRYTADSGVSSLCCVDGDQLRVDVAALTSAIEGYLYPLALAVHGGPGVEWSDE